MTTDISEKGLEALIVAQMTGRSPSVHTEPDVAVVARAIDMAALL